MRCGLLDDLVDKFGLLQLGMSLKNGGKLMRDTHSKGVCTSGQFEFYDLSNEKLKHGGFGQKKTIQIENVRFANAASMKASDRESDVRSVSFSIDVDGHRQDFSMNNDPAFTFGNLTDFNNFMAFGIIDKQLSSTYETTKTAAANAASPVQASPTNIFGGPFARFNGYVDQAKGGFNDASAKLQKEYEAHLGALGLPSRPG